MRLVRQWKAQHPHWGVRVCQKSLYTRGAPVLRDTVVNDHISSVVHLILERPNNRFHFNDDFKLNFENGTYLDYNPPRPLLPVGG